MKISIWLHVTAILTFVCTSTGGSKVADEDGICLKEESLGKREGNTYLCKDPELPMCCHDNDEYICCEAEGEKTLKDQIMLWAFVGLTFLAFALVVCLLTSQGDIWESETLRLASINLATQFGLTKVAAKIRKRKEGEEQTKADSNEELRRMPLAWF